CRRNAPESSRILDSHKVYYGKIWLGGNAAPGRCAATRHGALLPLVMIADELIEQPHAEAGSPAAIDLAVDRRHCSAGDVEMRPRLSFLDEARQKLRGRDRTAPFAAGILDVGDIGVDHFVVFRSKRQTPQFLSSDVAGLGQPFGELVVVAEQPGVLLT